MHLNDKVLSQALDRIYAYGLNKLYALVAEHTMQKLNLTDPSGLDAFSYKLKRFQKKIKRYV